MYQILTKQSCDAVANKPSWNGEKCKSVTVSVWPCNSGMVLLFRPQSSIGSTAKLEPMCELCSAMFSFTNLLFFRYYLHAPNWMPWTLPMRQCYCHMFDMSPRIYLWHRLQVSGQLELHFYILMPWIARPFLVRFVYLEWMLPNISLNSEKFIVCFLMFWITVR